MNTISIIILPYKGNGKMELFIPCQNKVVFTTSLLHVMELHS